MNQDDDDTGWLIDDDDAVAAARQAPAHSAAAAAPPWKVLIVDDDVDVHVVTKFALSNVSFRGRRLSFLHAYSGEEALTTLRNTPDIALVLLDVIMETSNAGLDVARQVRDVQHNALVRIVLRTGQPGQALEHSIILDYDINDFWCKTDLTTRKLFTTVIASLRAYATLHEAQSHAAALQAQLDHTRRLLDAVDQHAVIARFDARGRIVSVNDKFCSKFQFSRQELVGVDLRLLHTPPYPPDQLADALAALGAGESWSDVVTAWRRDGQELRLRVTASVVDDPAAPYVVVGSVMQALKKPL
ncbi:response regulator [Duganella sp. Leaf126]|uniref:PAS domain-containing protein n=1 Tax=Duganella sp. Leaf126 TaxID=1736266 RepID=UPI0006F87503|nr:PAS domain-containing protein [Duganella sp. Leaf126]KQQ40225.1 response regulator [Duganella sp. Leaf126]